MPNFSRSLSITDIDSQIFFDIHQGDPNTTFWRLSPEEIVFQPDNLGIFPIYKL